MRRIGFEVGGEDGTLLRPGDIVLMRGTGWLSRVILWSTRRPGEPPSVVSHVGLVDTPGDLETAEILEAVRVVRRGTLAELYRDEPVWTAVARPSSLSEDQLRAVVEASRRMEGRVYGYGKLVLHLLDGLLGGQYVFRRLARTQLPICSWHVAKAYSTVGVDFGMPFGAAQPDDIWDHCIQSDAEWSWLCNAALSELRLTSWKLPRSRPSTPPHPVSASMLSSPWTHPRS